MTKLSNFDFQYLNEAAKAFEKQIEGITAYSDPIEEAKLVVIHKNLTKKYELDSFDNDYQNWIDDFKLQLSEVEKENNKFERE